MDIPLLKSPAYICQLLSAQPYRLQTASLLNLNGRICAEGLLAFVIGGMAIVYFVAPFLDNYFRKIKLEIILPICAALMLIFVSDQLYTRKHPNTGEWITCMQDIDEKYMNNIC